MNNLINVQNQDGRQLVSARELYIGLGLSKEQWSRWYKKNIQDNYFFKENQDFTGVRHNVEGNEVQDFAITLEFAKHMAMMARTEKSHEYRNYFIDCEEKLRQQPALQELSPQLQFMINMEQEQKKMQQQLNQVNHHVLSATAVAEEAKQGIQAMRDTMLLDHDSWRKDCNSLINKIAKERGGTKEAYKEVRDEAYTLTEQRAGANLKQRVTNKQDRLRREGVGKSKIDAVSKVDAIAEDKRLKEIYIAVVKEMAIKYGVA